MGFNASINGHLNRTDSTSKSCGTENLCWRNGFGYCVCNYGRWLVDDGRVDDDRPQYESRKSKMNGEKEGLFYCWYMMATMLLERLATLAMVVTVQAPAGHIHTSTHTHIHTCVQPAFWAHFSCHLLVRRNGFKQAGYSIIGYG